MTARTPDIPADKLAARRRRGREVLVCFAAAVLLTALAGVVSACGGSASGQSLPPLAPASGSPAAAIAGGGLPPGCRCHSSNERLASMHKLFSVRDCEKCHDGNPEAMAQVEQPWTDARIARLEERMRSEAICLQCHKSGKTAVPSRLEAMRGRLFCPQDGKLYTRARAVPEGGHYVCPVHGVRLVDVDAVTAASEKQPSNTYCVACHPASDALSAKHESVARASQGADLTDCLSCHTSHSDCGSCHH